MFEKVARELRAKLVGERPVGRQAAGTTQNNPLKTNGPKNPDPSNSTNAEVLLPLDCRIARFRVVSGAGELGFLLLFHRESRVVTL